MGSVVCISLCVCVCERVCVYVCGPVQYSLGNGNTLPWQQLECCVNCSDVGVQYMSLFVCSRAEARQGQCALII